MRALVLMAAGLLSLATAAQAAPGEIKAGQLVIRQPVVRASLGHNPNSAAYFTVLNNGAKPERLLSAACACAAQVEAHVSEQKAGVMSMNAAGPVEIPPHGSVEFRPGGRHLMIMGLNFPLADGGAQDFTLKFERQGAVKVRFAVRAMIPSTGAAR